MDETSLQSFRVGVCALEVPVVALAWSKSCPGTRFQRQLPPAVNRLHVTLSSFQIRATDTMRLLLAIAALLPALAFGNFNHGFLAFLEHALIALFDPTSLCFESPDMP